VLGGHVQQTGHNIDYSLFVQRIPGSKLDHSRCADTGIFMARIPTDKFERVRIAVPALSQVIEIGAWDDIDTGTTVVPMQEHR
jgi:hypothetical protein